MALVAAFSTKKGQQMPPLALGLSPASHREAILPKALRFEPVSLGFTLAAPFVYFCLQPADRAVGVVSKRFTLRKFSRAFQPVDLGHRQSYNSFQFRFAIKTVFRHRISALAQESIAMPIATIAATLGR